MVLSQRIPPDFSKRSLHLYHQRPWGQLRVCRVMHLCNNSVHCRESACTGPVVFKAVLVTDAAFAGRHGALIVPLFSHTHHSLLCDDVRYMSCCDNKHRHNISEYIDYTPNVAVHVLPSATTRPRVAVPGETNLSTQVTTDTAVA